MTSSIGTIESTAYGEASCVDRVLIETLSIVLHFRPIDQVMTVLLTLLADTALQLADSEEEIDDLVGQLRAELKRQYLKQKMASLH